MKKVLRLFVAGTLTMKLIFRILKIIFYTIFTLFSAFLVWWLVLIPISNNIISSRYARKLEGLDAGVEYEIIEKANACGKLYGNGNGMEYMAMILVKSEVPLVEDTVQIDSEGSYNGIWITGLDSEKAKKQVYGWLSIHGEERVKNMKTALEALENPEGYYVFYSSYPAEHGSVLSWDLRAH